MLIKKKFLVSVSYYGEGRQSFQNTVSSAHIKRAVASDIPFATVRATNFDEASTKKGK